MAITQAATGEPLLKLRGIAKNFGAVQALSGVDLDVPSAAVTALCGDNGAGKSVPLPDAARALLESQR